VYWAPGSPSYDAYGRPALAVPVEISVRWEDRAIEFIDPQATRRVSRSIVYANQELLVGGKLMLGTLLSLPSNLEPPDGLAWEIIQADSIPNLRNTFMLRRAFL